MTKKATPKAKVSLEPEKIVDVPGQEAAPARPGEHDNDLKNIYAKSRKNRKDTVDDEAENHPDVDAIQAAVAEAAETEEFEHGDPDQIDLEERPDRFKDEDEGESEEESPVKVAKKDEASDEKPVVENKKPLDYEVVDGKVVVKVDGREYKVPESDIISAGGKAQYQRQRTANQRLELAATQSKALEEERKQLEQLRSGASDPRGLPTKQGVLHEGPELKDLKDRVLDAAIDGTEEDVERVLKEALESASKNRKTAEESGSSAQDVNPSRQIQEDFETAYANDRAEANRMLMDDYSDIMQDEELRAIANRKYKEIDADPDSFGRLPVEMAREAAEFVKRITSGAIKKDPGSQEQELTVRREKKRVLPQSSSARSRSSAPEQPKPPSAREYIQKLRRAQGHDKARRD